MVILIISVAILFFALVAQSVQIWLSDEDQIRSFLHDQGLIPSSVSRSMRTEVFARYGERYYECTYRDQEGVLHTRRVKVSFWKEVSFVD